MRRSAFALVFIVPLIAAAPAWAQLPRPLPPIVVDLRGVLARLGTDTTTAADLGVDTARLPTRGLGGVVGIHVYPVRRKISIGLGGEAILARARDQEKDAEGAPVGTPIERRLSGITAAESINFGDRDGWSYLSAGVGPIRFESFVGELPAAEAPPRKMTQHFGGGVRWFMKQHLAGGFDVRFYLTRPEDATATSAGRDRKRLLLYSVGISIK
jgi:hypothetical protein